MSFEAKILLFHSEFVVIHRDMMILGSQTLSIQFYQILGDLFSFNFDDRS